MINRNMRGIRSVGVKARLAVAAAVLVGGGAAGVVAVAANHGGSTAAATAESAGYTSSLNSSVRETQVLDEALNSWNKSQQSTAIDQVAELTQFRSFVQVTLHHHATLDAQRGIVVLATKKFLVVRSSNGSLHLWWLSKATGIKNVDASTTGWTAVTGSHSAATAAMTTGNMTPASTVVAGSTSVVSQLTTPVAKPTTITIDSGGQVITITVASSTATVTQPTTTTATTTQTRQSAWSATGGVQRGDLVIVAGTSKKGQLNAAFVLFAPVASVPSAHMTAPVSPTPTPTASSTPNTTISGQPVSIGTSS
jgi:hypothetical protein